MLNKQDIVDFMDKGLAEGRRNTTPYLLYDFSPFSDEVYDLILKHLPADSAYFEVQHPGAKRPDGTYARHRFPLEKNHIDGLPAEQRDFWNEFREILKSDELRDVFKKWLEPTLTKRFKCPLNEIPAYPWPQLLRDTHGYMIGAHPDTDFKVITTQWYLPANNDQRHLGTKLHEKYGTGLKESGMVEFLPNRGYAFGVDDDSWHSVAPMQPGDGIRNSMMVTYCVEEIGRPSAKSAAM